MDYPSFSQLSLLLKNDTDFPLDKLIDKEYFIVAFIEHMKENFKKLKRDFKILIPLLDPSFEEEQTTTISLDGIELGELSFLYNSVSSKCSLVYSSTSALLETIIFDGEDYPELTISDYVLMLHEFSAMIIGESILYKEIKGA